MTSEIYHKTYIIFNKNKIMKYNLLLVLMFMLASCKNSGGDIKHKIVSEKHTKSKESNTICVSGKSVVFFTISQKEYDSIAKDSNSGIDEVLSDFNSDAETINDTIKKLGFKCTMTASRFIKVKLENGTIQIFDRLSNKESVTGFILSNGLKKPKIGYGLDTSSYFLTLFNEFTKP